MVTNKYIILFLPIYYIIGTIKIVTIHMSVNFIYYIIYIYNSYLICQSRDVVHKNNMINFNDICFLIAKLLKFKIFLTFMIIVWVVVHIFIG